MNMKTPVIRYTHFKLLPIALSVSLALSGCAGMGKESAIDTYLRDGPKTLQGGLAAKMAQEERSSLIGQTQGVPGLEEVPGRTPAIVMQGTDTMIAPPRGASARGGVRQQGEMVSLEFADAPLSEVVQALLGDMLKLTYTVEFMPEGRVSLRTGGQIPQNDILPIVESMLQNYGAAMVRDAQNIYHITQMANVQQYAPSLFRANDPPPGFGMVVVPLRYIGAADMAEILQPVAPEGSIIRIDPMRNLLILAGNRAQHEGWQDIIRSFDINYLKGMSLAIFPLEHTSVGDVYDTVSAMLGGSIPSGGAGMSGGGTGMPGGGNISGGGASIDSGSGSGAALGSAVKLFPIQRLNSLVVVSPRAESIEIVRNWIVGLDQPSFNNLEPQLYVYYVQNGSATHLAELVGSIYSGSMGGASSDSGVAPGLNQTSLSGSGSNRSASSTFSTNNSSSSSGSSSSGSSPGGGGSNVTLPDTDANTENLTTQINLGEQVRVVADERINALLIQAPRKDYRKIEAALRQLDMAPTQILIEASIVEVALVGSLSYGLEWAFRNNSGTGIGALVQAKDSNLFNEGLPSGFSYSFAGNQVSAVLQALASDNLLRMLSNPTLLVQDNYTASIHVGTNQPIQLSSTTSLTSEREQYNYGYKDTGVMLTVTPSTNASGLVSMTIHQAVTDLGSQDEKATGQYAFNQREVKSRVSVRSGETVVIGGLIRDNTTNVETGIPVLHKLPLVGNLFGSTTKRTERTELLVLITPRVIANEAELNSIGEEIRSRMRNTMKDLERRGLPYEKRSGSWGTGNNDAATVYRRDESTAAPPPYDENAVITVEAQ